MVYLENRLVNKRNNKRLKLDPCGTPDQIKRLSDVKSLCRMLKTDDNISKTETKQKKHC